MGVEECDVPHASLLDPAKVRAADFKDAYRAPIARSDQGMVELFAALFGHHPLPVKLALVARNAVAGLCGLNVPPAADILRPAIRGSYAVGDKIGPWPVFAITEHELIAGRDNGHMDFRLSVLKTRHGDAASVTVSTICNVHNDFGRVYLRLITPFHRAGVKSLMARALAAGRL